MENSKKKMQQEKYIMADPVASKTITVSEMVMRAIPLVMAAAPINAYVPLSAKVPSSSSK